MVTSAQLWQSDCHLVLAKTDTCITKEQHNGTLGTAQV